MPYKLDDASFPIRDSWHTYKFSDYSFPKPTTQIITLLEHQIPENLKYKNGIECRRIALDFSSPNGVCMKTCSFAPKTIVPESTQVTIYGGNRGAKFVNDNRMSYMFQLQKIDNKWEIMGSNQLPYITSGREFVLTLKMWDVQNREYVIPPRNIPKAKWSVTLAII